jgi:hypothetical protein
MVALNTDYAPSKTSTRSQNRVGDFFCEAEKRVGKNRLASRIGTKEKTTYSYETASGLPVWPSRDPMEEDGGLNLFGFVKNNPINQWDLLGQKTSCSDFSKTRGSGDSAEGRTTTQVGTPSSNGCGASGSSYTPPQGFFSVSFVSSCDTHDICYGTCGSSKSGCDSQFRSDLRAACDAVYNRFNIPARAACYAVAHTYYLGVHHGGGAPFEAAQDQFCEWESCCE